MDEEVFRVGVSLAITPGLGAEIDKVIEYFLKLDKSIEGVRGNLKAMLPDMQAVTKEGQSAAAAWKGVAAAVERTERAMQRAGAAAASGARARSSGAASATGTSPAAVPSPYPMLTSQPRGRAPSPEMAPIPLPDRNRWLPVPYNEPERAVVPYWDQNTNFNLDGDSYHPYGTGIPNGRRRTSGGALIPYIPPSGGGGGGDDRGGFTTAGNPYDPAGGPVGPYRGEEQKYSLSPRSMTYDEAVRLNRNVRGAAGPSAADFDPVTTGLGALGGYEALKFIWGKTAEKDALQARLLAQGFSAKQASQAYNLADQTRVAVPGSNITGNLEITSDLMTVLQNQAMALQLMPDFAKLGVTLGAFNQAPYYQQIMNSVSSAELRGVLSHKVNGKEVLDPGALHNFIKDIVATDVFTGGRIGPQQILQFMRSGGASTALMADPELFAKSATLMLSMGPSRAGRGMQGFFQQFVAGKMSEAAANMLIGMDIIHGGGDARHNPYLRKNGIGTFELKPGAMSKKDYDEASVAPYAFILDKLLPKFDKYIQKFESPDFAKLPEKQQLAEESAVASQIASRIPGGNAMVDVIRNMLLLDRDISAFNLAGSRDVYGIQQANNPLLKVQALTAAVDALATHLGDSSINTAINGLNNVTKDLDALGAWSQQHEQITAIGLEALTGALIALGVGAGAVALGALGGAGGLLAGVGTGAAIAVHELKQLGDWLHSKFPAFFNDNGLHDIRKNGVHLPSWVPLPGNGRKVMPPNPGWPNDLSFGPNGEGYSPSSGGFAPRGTSGPVPVTVNGTVDTNSHITNPNDLVHGLSEGQARAMGGPPKGMSGLDPRINPGSAYLGLPPFQ